MWFSSNCEFISYHFHIWRGWEKNDRLDQKWTFLDIQQVNWGWSQDCSPEGHSSKYYFLMSQYWFPVFGSLTFSTKFPRNFFEIFRKISGKIPDPPSIPRTHTPIYILTPNPLNPEPTQNFKHVFLEIPFSVQSIVFFPTPSNMNIIKIMLLCCTTGTVHYLYCNMNMHMIIFIDRLLFGSQHDHY